MSVRVFPVCPDQLSDMHHYCDDDKWHTHNHYTALFPGLPGWASANSSGFYGAREENREADTPTTRLGATPSGLISDPPPSHFYTGCPSCCKFYRYCSKLLFNQFIFRFGQVSKGVQWKLWKLPCRKWMHFLTTCENNEILPSTSHVNHMSSTAWNSTEFISFKTELSNTVYTPQYLHLGASASFCDPRHK